MNLIILIVLIIAIIRKSKVESLPPKNRLITQNYYTKIDYLGKRQMNVKN